MSQKFAGAIAKWKNVPALEDESVTQETTEADNQAEEPVETVDENEVVTKVSNALADDTQGYNEATDSVEEAYTEVKDAEDSLDELAVAQESLEQIYAGLESAHEEGGLNAQAASMLAIAIRPFDGLLDHSIVPATESFGGSSSRYRSTCVALEDIKETAKKVWDTIVKAFKQLIAFIQDAFSKITLKNQRIQEAAKKLADATSKMGNVDVSGKQISVGGQSNLFIDGRYTTDGVKVVKDMAVFMSTTYPKDVVAYIGKFRDFLVDLSKEAAKTGSSKEHFEALVGKGTAELAKALPRFKIVSNAKEAPFALEGDDSVTRTAILPGNKALFVKIAKDDANGDYIKVIKSIEVGFGTVGGHAAAPKEKQVDVRNPRELTAALKDIVSACEAVTHADAEMKTIRNSLSEALKLTPVDESVDAAYIRFYNTLISNYLRVSRLLSGKTVIGTYSYMLDILAGQVNLAKREISAYGKKEATDDAK